MSFEWIAHRGYSSCYPENTLVAFEAAVAAGAGYIEADFQLSMDAVPFVFHDRDLQRLCGRRGRLEQLHSRELTSCSAHWPKRFGTRFLGEPLLPLARLLEWLDDHPQVTLYLEAKRFFWRSQSDVKLLHAIWPLLWPRRHQLVLISFSLPLLEEARHLGLPRLAPVARRWFQLAGRRIRRLEPEAVFLDYRRLPARAEPRKLPFALALYEISDPQVAETLARRGARLIETDDIGAMIAATEYARPQ